LFFNCFIMATVNLAAVKIANIAFGWEPIKTLVLCGVVNIFFAATSGLWGVLVIDMIQFGIAMTGAVSLAYFALQQPEVGGLAGLVDKVGQVVPLNSDQPNALKFLPSFNNWDVAVGIFIMPILVQWWSVWYPGAEPGGGSYIAQRMLAAKTERDALGGTLFFNCAHYALRPWPWILVALATFLIYPLDPPEKMEAARAAITQAGGADQVDEATRMAARGLTSLRDAYPEMPENKMGHDMAYPAMLKFLPPGFLGIMLAGLLAAYVSTMITHLNWGSSYLVHDFYQRFLKPGASDKHYVMVGRITTALLMVLAAWLTLNLETAKTTFNIILSIGAGTGLIYLLRWFWWRINAWTEIAAMLTSFVIAITLLFLSKGGFAPPTHITLIASVAITTVVWLIVAYCTPPTRRESLKSFYMLIRPAGPGWKGFREETGVPPAKDSLPSEMLGWGVGTAAVWAALFSTGYFLLGRPLHGAVVGVIFVACTIILVRLIPRLWAADKG
jgi:Na+/proline symporter